MKLKIAFSPCPNDTFIFDALINQKIDTEGFEFETVLQDVQALNQNALNGEFDIAKVSYGAYASLADNYIILNSGSALGFGVGPLLISNKELKGIDVNSSIVAIPGENTTAHFLFSTAYPEANQKIFLRYDEIEHFVLSGKGLGVIIHENRFTYQDKRLHKIIDLGEFWEKATGCPIPLGGIVINRKYENQVQSKIDELIKKSIEFAFSNYPNLTPFVTSNAQEMSEEVMRKHIDLYVNQYSLGLGEVGKDAIKMMLQFFNEDLFDNPNLPLFV